VEDEMNRNLIEGFKQSTTQLNETLNDLINVLIIKDNKHLTVEKISLPEITKYVKMDPRS
jgi:hypothetical protein